MGHDASKVVLGAVKSSFKEVGNHKGSIPAGKVVRLKSDDTISLAKADGNLLGVSIGVDQSDIGRTAICYKGTGVPIRLTAAFTPTVGAIVHVSDTTGLAIASGAGATATNAVYREVKAGGGIEEDGSATDVDVAIIDFPGGL